MFLSQVSRERTIFTPRISRGNNCTCLDLYHLPARWSRNFMARLRRIAAFVAAVLDWVLINVFAGGESGEYTKRRR